MIHHVLSGRVIETQIGIENDIIQHMMAEWRELGTLTKIIYIGGVVSAIGLAVMILSGMTGAGGILSWEKEFYEAVPMVYVTHKRDLHPLTLGKPASMPPPRNCSDMIFSAVSSD